MCVWHTAVCVWVSVCTGQRGLGVVCRILDKVGALPKDGWRNWFFRSILLKIPIFPQGTKCALVFGFLASGRKQGMEKKKKKMELLISLTSPCCCCSARSGQHSSYDECLISRNTSQIAKLYLNLLSISWPISSFFFQIHEKVSIFLDSSAKKERVLVNVLLL